MKAEPPADDHATGLPGLRRWRSVYLVVTIIFVGWILLLTVLTRCYS